MLGSRAWLNRFAWLTAGATLFLICSGGMVTSKNAGLAVPDWPTSFGYNMFLFPISKWVGGIFFEHIHRLIASTVGLFTVILAAWLWFAESRPCVRNLGLAAVAAVILQGVLGGIRVTMMKDEIGIFHACLAQAFFGLLVVIAIVTSRFRERTLPACSLRHPAEAFSSRDGSSELSQKVCGRDAANSTLEACAPGAMSPPHIALRRIALMTTALIYLQLVLGATMRHQHRDLSITDFPTAYGQWLPDTSAPAINRINAARDALAMSDVSASQIWLQMAHRFGALLVAAGVIAFFVGSHRRSSATLRKLSATWLFAVAVQISLGAWTIWSNKAADIATAHVAVGAIVFALGVMSCAFCLWGSEELHTTAASPLNTVVA